MKVLSLFDGISCGRVALERARIPVEKYYASEIDKYAIQVAMKNYPDIIQIGDVTKIDFTKYRGEVDLVIGGSPCQGFSFAGKQLNFNDPRSKLFFEFVRAIKEIQPKYFLLENVKMKQEFQDVISEQLGVQPIEINSALVSAQNRKRLYWTNIPGVCQPEDKGILLKDIVLENTGLGVLCKKCGKEIVKSLDKSTCLMARDYKGFANQAQCGVFEALTEYIVPFDKTLRIIEKEVEKGKVGYFRKDSQANRVYFIHDKAVTLCGDAGGGAAKMGQYLFGCITPDRVEKRQNGQRFNDGKKFYTLTAQDQHGILVEGYIRKLTPIECERLQTLPDDYTGGVSNSQRYKMLGNGWTVDVIAHIFKGLAMTENKTLTNYSEKMKCPFCGAEIHVAHEFLCVCNNDKCKAWGVGYPKFVLQALISGKQAKDALLRIKERTDAVVPKAINALEAGKRVSDALSLAQECLHKCKTRDHVGAICRLPTMIEEYEKKIQSVLKGDSNG